MSASVHRRTIQAFAAAWILFWLLFIAISVQDYLRSGRSAIWEPIFWDGSAVIVANALAALQRPLFRAYDRYLDRPVRWFVAQLPWLPVMCIGFVVVEYSLRYTVYAMLGLQYQHPPWGSVFLYESVKVSLFYLVVITIMFGVLSYGALAQEKERAERSAALLRQAQLQSLAHQIQPHFLFNALNTISSLMHTDAQRADAMLAQLSEVLRASLDLGDRLETDVRQELTILRAYAQLMEERFADRVEIVWDIDDDVLDCRMPAMSLQPLLENTFKHTIERRSKPARIRVGARRAGQQLVLSIEDDAGTLVPAAQPGIGIRNLRERLAVLHGDRAAFHLVQLDPAGVRSEIQLPCGY